MLNLNRKRNLIPSLVLITLAPLVVWFGLWGLGLMGVSPEVKFNLSDRLADLKPIERDGQWYYEFEQIGGGTILVSSEQFTAELAQKQHTRQGRRFLFAVLDITAWTSIFWVIVGLAGQLMFTGRMLVQWIVSEKKKRSVVPNVFWWLSLGGASMLIIYFIWRKDIVGILGQSTGWFIYIRNIWLIYQPRAIRPTLNDDPGPEPELAVDPYSGEG